MIEAMQHAQNAFVTLTYSNETLPLKKIGTGSNSYMAGNLVPRDLQLFLKRLRKSTPQQVRFFGVGEYGEATWRPHFHLGIFNFQNCARGETKQSPGTGRRLWAECCSQCAMVGTIWGKGDIEIRNLDPGKSGYLAGYVTKKMTAKEDARLLGRHPEFSRMSRRPGIGVPGVAQMAEVIRSMGDVFTLHDVPTHLLHERKQLVLGRLLRRKLRLALGLDEKTPDAVRYEIWEKTMLPVLNFTKKNEEGIVSVKAAFAALNAAYAESLEMKNRSTGKGKI